ncbi:hypothetical protein HK103_001522 [Boothiomyces macroporosus]|uniref:Uncharacterized protein n=1 Tax=Boothiomyces macroporosus TaxID=261099 RepID=A0AAD5Y5J1_9FUNG|nr:hypothetical protein HK103_001522 [Boothiomyces macroporosus]
MQTVFLLIASIAAAPMIECPMMIPQCFPCPTGQTCAFVREGCLVAKCLPADINGNPICPKSGCEQNPYVQ